jgi:hypothetical protein
MTDIVERLRATLLDKDNFPRMKSETHLPVGLAKEAADEIERLRASYDQFRTSVQSEIARWQDDARAQANVQLSEENDALIDENKRLRAEIELVSK